MVAKIQPLGDLLPEYEAEEAERLRREFEDPKNQAAFAAARDRDRAKEARGAVYTEAELADHAREEEEEDENLVSDEADQRRAAAIEEADGKHVDGIDRDDLGESPDY